MEPADGPITHRYSGGVAAQPLASDQRAALADEIAEFLGLVPQGRDLNGLEARLRAVSGRVERLQGCPVLMSMAFIGPGSSPATRRIAMADVALRLHRALCSPSTVETWPGMAPLLASWRAAAQQRRVDAAVREAVMRSWQKWEDWVTTQATVRANVGISDHEARRIIEAFAVASGVAPEEPKRVVAAAAASADARLAHLRVTDQESRHARALARSQHWKSPGARLRHSTNRRPSA